MVQLVDDLDLLDEVRDVLVAEPSLFYVLLDGHLLAVEFAQEDLPVAALPMGYMVSIWSLLIRKVSLIPFF